jgi:hypothetical protein
MEEVLLTGPTALEAERSGEGHWLQIVEAQVDWAALRPYWRRLGCIDRHTPARHLDVPPHGMGIIRGPLDPRTGEPPGAVADDALAPAADGDAVDDAAVLLFKLLLLQDWYHLSEAEIVALAADRISFRRFLGQDHPAPLPSAAALRRFRQALERAGIWRDCRRTVEEKLRRAGHVVLRGLFVDALLMPERRHPTSPPPRILADPPDAPPLMAGSTAGEIARLAARLDAALRSRAAEDRARDTPPGLA